MVSVSLQSVIFASTNLQESSAMRRTGSAKFLPLFTCFVMLWTSANAQAQTISLINVTNHNHISSNFNNNELLSIGAAPNGADLSMGEIGVIESPFFALAAPSGGLSGDLGFANNPNLDGGPTTSATATISGTFTLVGDSTAAGEFTDGNGLPAGITATYDISFGLSTTDGSILSAGVSESNGFGAGNGDAFFTPANGNFSGNLIFGAATISNVSFSGTPTDAGFVFSNGTVDSIDLLGLSSASFTGTNDAVLLAADNTTVLVDFTTDPVADPTETFLNATNDNLFDAQELGNAILAVTNGGLHVRGFTLGANLSYEIASSNVLKGDVDMSEAVDFSDIPAFITVLQSGVFQAEADCDCSGVVDFSDIPAFILILQAG